MVWEINKFFKTVSSIQCLLFLTTIIYKLVYFIFPGGAVVKNPPASAGDERDVEWIPGQRRSPGAETVTGSSILARKIPWTEEPGML